MTDIVLRMKTLPDLTNEKAWETVYEGAKEIERLREALKPFAEFAGQRVGRPPDDMVITQGSRIARRQLTMGDCARAAEALSR